MNASLLAVVIIGLWAGAVHEPLAITMLAKNAGVVGPAATRFVGSLVRA